MSITSIQSDEKSILQAMQKMQNTLNHNVEDSSTKANFNDILSNAMHAVNETQNDANRVKASFEQGDDISLAEVMLAQQKSTVAFQSLMQFRNKFVSAYKEIMNMSV